MEKARVVSAIFLGAFVTIFGTWALNSFVVSGLLGETGREAYSFTVCESVLRFVFYVAIAVSISLITGKKRVMALAVTGVVSIVVLVMNTHNWMSPEMSAYAKVTAYLIAYSPTFTVVPAFILVGFVFSKWKKIQQTET